MITEIPTPEEFRTAGLNMLYLAWEIAIDLVSDFDQVEDYGGWIDGDTDADAYWERSQPALGNAFSLIQQAMELAVKGQIAAITPFLLIDRSPREMPSGSDKKAVPFSEFRTIDASDLVRVHNTFSAKPLSDEFRNFFDDVRRQRNALMHSVPRQTFRPNTVLANVLVAAQHLFGDETWPKHCNDRLEQSRFMAVGVGVDDTMNHLLRQMGVAIRNLTPSEARTLLGFDKKRHSYRCEECIGQANTDYDQDFPNTVQFTEKRKGATELRCFVCGTTSTATREECESCDANVIVDGVCLVCGEEQPSTPAPPPAPKKGKAKQAAGG